MAQTKDTQLTLEQERALAARLSPQRVLDTPRPQMTPEQALLEAARTPTESVLAAMRAAPAGHMLMTDGRYHPISTPSSRAASRQALADYEARLNEPREHTFDHADHDRRRAEFLAGPRTAARARALGFGSTSPPPAAQEELMKETLAHQRAMRESVEAAPEPVDPATIDQGWTGDEQENWPL